MSGKQVQKESREKSFRIDDLLQKKSSDPRDPYPISKASCDSDYSESNKKILQPGRTRDTSTRNSTVKSTSTSRGTNSDESGVVRGSSEISSPVSPASSTTSSSASSSSQMDRGVHPDYRPLPHPAFPYGNLPPGMYANPHLLHPLQMQFGGSGPGSAVMGMGSQPYGSSSTSAGGGSDRVWNGDMHPAGTQGPMSHFPTFSNFIVPSQNYGMHPASNPSIWPRGSHSLLEGTFLDPRVVDRNFPYSAYLSQMASYGVPYVNGRGINPLLNIGSKRKGGQIRFTNSQTAQLEKAFFKQKYLNAIDRKKLAESLLLSDRQVKTWFQNRRAKWRKNRVSEDTPPDYSSQAFVMNSPSQLNRNPNGSEPLDDGRGNRDSS